MTEQSLRHAIEAVRSHINAELEAQLALLAERHDTDLVNVRLATEREIEARKAATPASSGPDPSDLFRQIDAESSISGVLTATVNGAASAGTRAALFVGPAFERWQAGTVWNDGLEGRLDALKAAAASARAVKNGDRSIAAPLVLDGTSVAVLYVEHDAPPSDAWSHAIELLARYASARLAYLTAWRAAQAHQRLGPAATSTSAGPAVAPETQGDNAELSARRYARLLVSEIKLYNEAAVREGRAQRDLGRRLAGDIERARRLYEERVSSTVSGRSQYFQQELVQTLAGGDPSLLG
ncbi:MAG TPA: hypothetical protein VGD94_16700 [Vicinamibacterales bacterium]